MPLTFHRSLTGKLLCCSALLLFASPLWLGGAGAQPPADNPFGDGAAQPAPAKKGGAAGDPQINLRRDESPVILQLRESNPTTADDLVGAAAAVLRFGRPDECKRYLAKFLTGRFPEDELAAVAGKHGTAFFLDIGAQEAVQPEGAQVAAQVLTAARKAAENPARLAALVKTLSDPNYEAAAAALTRLEQAGPALVAPVLQALADPSRAGEHARLYAALRDLSATTEAPLIGTLAGAPEPQQIIAANVLGQIGSRDAVRHLLAPALATGVSPPLREAARRALTNIMGGVPRQHDSELYLLRQFDQLRDGQHPFKPDADNNTVVWQWDSATGGPASRILPVQDAIRQLSARLATDLQRLDPAKREYQKLRLLHYLEFSKAIGGLDKPLPPNSPAVALAKDGGEQLTAEVLALAMTERKHAAAIAATEILAEIGTAALLATDGPAPGVLATALTHADGRLRLAAALTIVKLNPPASFAGASHVAEVLGHAVRTAGVNRVLIVDSRSEYAQTLAGLLADEGYYGEIAIGSQQAFHLATTGADYELILVSDALDRPVTEMVQLLRRDRRTALIPVGVMVGAATVDDLPKVFHDSSYRDPVGRVRNQSVQSVATLFADDRRAYVAPRPHTSATVAFLAAQVRQRGGRELTSREERLANGRSALAAFNRLVSDPAALGRYDVLRQESALITALATPSLLAPAAEVLGKLATPKAQTALVDIVSQPARPLADRQAALTAFQAAVKLRGILLTQRQILAQYDRYNDSETLDAGTQGVLAAVLDTLESRRQPPPVPQ